jgi:peptidoglycan hydrolase-like protein with peptidoglycan-binding domain
MFFMQKFILGAMLSALLVASSPLALAQETTTNTTSQSALLAQIESLMKLIANLQSQITAARGEIKELAQDLKLGSQSDEVEEIQELLASDPELFGVTPTGYYGPLTEAAIKKLQDRYGLPVTGIVDEATRELMRELKMEKKNGMVPPGLVKSDEVKARIKDRLQEKWGDCVWGEKFRASDCKKGKTEDMDDDEDEDTEVTRDDARRAVVDAQNALNTYRDSIDDMEDDDVDEDVIDEAIETLREAQKQMAEARRALARGKFEEAADKAAEVLEILDEEDDSDL